MLLQEERDPYAVLLHGLLLKFLVYRNADILIRHGERVLSARCPRPSRSLPDLCQAIEDAFAGKTVSVCSLPMKAFRAMTKVLPWDLILNYYN